MAHTALLVTLLLLQSTPPLPQTQNPPHQRITKTEPIGNRRELASLKGARLFTSPSVNPGVPVPLLVHFHGAPWLIETHVARHLPEVALITVQLGAGSSAYRRPFENPDLFRELMNEAAHALSLKRGWSSVTLVSFSAGYGGVREILRRPEYFALVDNVLLLDGLHASYSGERNSQADPSDAEARNPKADPSDAEARKLKAEPEVRNEPGRKLLASDIDIFVTFAREAVLNSFGSPRKKTRAGRKTHARRKTRAPGKTSAPGKTFVVTHSEIFPGTYASTTECADYLLAQLNLKRHLKRARGPMAMHQLTAVDAGGFRVRGYAGNTAPDHVDFLHAMPAWFSLLRIK